jgi:hypothetical protein
MRRSKAARHASPPPSECPAARVLRVTHGVLRVLTYASPPPSECPAAPTHPLSLCPQSESACPLHCLCPRLRCGLPPWRMCASPGADAGQPGRRSRCRRGRSWRGCAAAAAAAAALPVTSTTHGRMSGAGPECTSRSTHASTCAQTMNVPAAALTGTDSPGGRTLSGLSVSGGLAHAVSPPTLRQAVRQRTVRPFMPRGIPTHGNATLEKAVHTKRQCGRS